MYFSVLGDREVLEFINNEKYNGTYKEFANSFTAELFEPEAWAELFARAGAKFVAITFETIIL